MCIRDSPATIRIMESKGFKAGKIKASANLAAALERLTMLASMVPSWRWRLDFNGCLNENDALKFWKSLPHHLKTRIDFIEDPCPFSIQSWERLVDAGITKIKIRSILTCESELGICAKCYGANLALSLIHILWRSLPGKTAWSRASVLTKSSSWATTVRNTYTN